MRSTGSAMSSYEEVVGIFLQQRFNI
jgi:hypothetical protein